MEKKWWHDKIVYQIYPKSFKDANNDGIGDIKGIIEKIDYLKDLGVDILWLTPFFKSPMEDNGYDVADYLSVDKLFGSNEDLDNLIQECKKRDMYIMIDIVANHTSSEHMWFQMSKKSKDNKYRDYYIWRDTPPFDNQSTFGGSAWEYDENTNQYYFHEFGVGQPDLNWENPKVMEEFANLINYWMEKGVKGIRFDVIHLIGKEIDKDIHAYGPTLHSKIKELAKKSYGKYDIITVGEAWGTIQNALDFTLPENKELNMVFQFECTSSTCDFTRFGKFSPKPVDMKFIKDTLTKYQIALNDVSWNALFVENHDLGRCINKFGDPINYYEKSAKEIAVMNYLLKGTPFIYQGQELGMLNQKIDDVNEYNDIEIHGFYKEYVVEKKVMSVSDFLQACYQEGRDNNRFPMQWNDSINAGFNSGFKPWLKINPNYREINARKQLKDENSILSFYKQLIRLRKDDEYLNTFVYGKFEVIDVNNDNVFVYTRSSDENKVVIICNMREYNEIVTIPYEIEKKLLSNYDDVIRQKCTYHIRPYEAIVAKIKD